MPRKFIIAAIAAAFALVACTEEIQKPGEKPVASENVHTLSVGIEAGAYVPVDGETKASMEAVIRVRWQQNDEVSVVNATTGKILGGCLKATEEGTVVTFEGTVTGTINQGDRLYYIYPRVAKNTEEVTFAGYNVSLASQTYDAQKAGDVCFYGYAEDVATGTSTEISKKIQFNLVTSYAHFNMASLPAKGVSLSSVDISNVNGGFTWTLTGNALSATPYEVNGGISVRCNAGITASGNAVARFAIPVSAASEQDRVITVNKAYTTNFSKIALPASSYFNLLYSIWTKKDVTVNQTDTEKNKVDISNDESKETAEGTIPTEAFEENKATEIKMGGVGTVIFDEEASEKIKQNAGSSTEVFFKVEDVTTTKPVQNADVVYEVTMKTLDQDGKEVFNEANAKGKVTIIIPLEEDVVYIRMVTLVKDDGTPIDGGVVEDSIVLDLDKHTLTFQVEHFSKYAVGYVKRADFISVTGVSLNKNALILPVNDTETLVATVAPDNATNPKVKWTSSNTAVATVDKEGKVTAVGHGTATITVTTEDVVKTTNQPATATCAVTVKTGTGFGDYEEGGNI